MDALYQYVVYGIQNDHRLKITEGNALLKWKRSLSDRRIKDIRQRTPMALISINRSSAAITQVA